jgi:hypothetical protein
VAAGTPLSSAEAALRRIVSVLVIDDADAEALIRGLQERGWRVLAAMEQEAARRLASVRLAMTGADASGAVIDLLFASSGIEREIVDAADPIDVVPGFEVAIARLGHLIALKVLARDDRTRPQDRVDLAALLRRADAAALGEARAALEAVARRGFHRGRDLPAALEAAADEFRV